MSRRSVEDVRQRFRDRYRVSGTDAQLQLEETTLGTDFGATGWTTRTQADEMADRLALGPGDRLLDVGSGRGWSGLYLAITTGCHVVLTDPAVEGLSHGASRARTERVQERCTAVACTADALPFRRESFDAVVHTDVLC